MNKIQKIICKRFLWCEYVERIQLIVIYKSGRIFQGSYFSPSEIPYTFRDFMSPENMRGSRDLSQKDSLYHIIQNEYEEEIISEGVYKLQE